MSDSEGFLGRWSRKKLETGKPGDSAAPAAKTATAELPPAADSADAGTAALEPGPGETGAEPFPFDESDVEKLGPGDDFTAFLKENVPQHIRRLALRKLWQSDPAFAILDGLNDYDENFTDAALAVEALQSAYRVGKGHLSDEELDEQAAAGVPPDEAPETGETETAGEDEDGGETDATTAQEPEPSGDEPRQRAGASGDSGDEHSERTDADTDTA